MQSGIRSSKQNAPWGGEEEHLERNNDRPLSSSCIVAGSCERGAFWYGGDGDCFPLYNTTACCYDGGDCLYGVASNTSPTLSPVTMRTFEPFSSPTSAAAYKYSEGFPERFPFYTIMLPAILGFAMFK